MEQTTRVHANKTNLKFFIGKFLNGEFGTFPWRTELKNTINSKIETLQNFAGFQCQTERAILLWTSEIKLLWGNFQTINFERDLTQ